MSLLHHTTFTYVSYEMFSSVAAFVYRERYKKTLSEEEIALSYANHAKNCGGDMLPHKRADFFK